MKKIIGIFICIILIGTIIPVGINATYNYDPLDGGWLEERDGVTILHVSGTNYEMGYQHGFLLKDKIEQNYRALFSLDNNREYYDFIIDKWNTIIKQNTPDYYIEEMQGLADGSGKILEDVIVFVVGHGMFGAGCMEMAAWGTATVDGKLRHLYSCDLSLNAKDPESNTYLQENQIIIVRKPDEGYSSLESFFAGTFAGTGGINENQIAISMQVSPSSEFTWNKTIIWFRILNVLDYSYSLEEATDIMISNRNGIVNYIISDGKIPMSHVCEETANFSYVGTWDDDIESINPFWQIENVVRRKNMYIHPTTTKTQRKIYDPRIYLITGLLTGDPWFNTWSYYKTISQEIEKQWGNLDSMNIMSTVRSIYKGETNIYLKLSGFFGLEKFSAFHQWVACPETGDILISFADGDYQAQYNKIHQFNLFNLIESEPP